MRVRIGLQNKLILYSAALILVMSFVFNSFLVSRQRQLLFTALEDRGQTIANGIANNCQFSILAEDKSSLRGFIEGAMTENDVLSVAIVNKDGKTLAHNNEEMVGQDTGLTEAQINIESGKVEWLGTGQILVSVPVKSKLAQSGGGSDLDLMLGFGDSSQTAVAKAKHQV